MKVENNSRWLCFCTSTLMIGFKKNTLISEVKLKLILTSCLWCRPHVSICFEFDCFIELFVSVVTKQSYYFGTLTVYHFCAYRAKLMQAKIKAQEARS